MLTVLHVFQNRKGYWNSVRARDRSYLIGQRGLYGKGVIDS